MTARASIRLSLRGTSGRPWRVALTPFRMASGVLALIVAFVIIYPALRLIYAVFVEGGRFNLSAFREAFSIPGVATSIIPNTLIIVASSTVLALTVSTIFAWINERTNARVGILARILPLCPLLVPALASTIGWAFLLSPQSGILNILIRSALSRFGLDLASGPLSIYNIYGMIFLYTLLMTAFAYLPISSALSQMDPGLEEAARVSGAGPLSSFWAVAVKANRHAIMSAAMICVVIGFATFAVPFIIGTTARVDVLSVEIYRLMTAEFPARTQPAVALSLVMVVVIFGFWLVQERFNRSRRFATIGGKGIRAGLVNLGRLRWAARAFMVLFVLLSCVIPLCGLIYISLIGFWSSDLTSRLTLANYREIFSSAAVGVGNALQVSLTLGLAGAAAAVIISSTLVVFADVLGTRYSRVVNGLTKLPAVIPQLVLGVGFLTAFSSAPLRLYGTSALLLISYLIIYLPQTTIMANTAYISVGSELTEAAAIAGAGGWEATRRILLPLMIPGLAGIAAVQFVLIIGESTVSPLLASPSSPVLGYVMVGLWENATFPQIAALGVVMTGISTLVVSGFLWLASRRSGVSY